MALHRLRPVLLLSLPVLLAVVASLAAAAQPADLLLSEYVEGSSLNKAVEIFNGTGAAIDLGLADYRLEVYFNGHSSAGTTVDLVGVVAPGDVFVVADDGADPVILAATDQTTTSSLWNGDDAIVLTKAGTVIDSFGQVGFDPGSQWGSGGTGAANHTLRRKVSVCTGDTDTGDAFDPATEWDGFPSNTFDGLGAHTVSCGAPPPPPPPPPPPATAEIFEIQGSGLTSPLVGQTVTTEANVVTALAYNGFFIQTPDGRADADPETSNGVFVFTGGAPGVSVGDEVDVTGDVSEYFDFTELGGGPTVTVVASGVPLPAAVTLDDATPSPDQPQPATELERYEGMRVAVAGGRVTSGNQRFGSDPVAEAFVVAGPDRPFREPGIAYPGLPGLPVWDGNPEVFELDPDRLGLPNQVLTGGSSFSAEGVLGYEFGGYELWPTALSVDPAPLPVPVSPRLTGERTVGSLNLFRLFDDVDDPGGETVVSTAEYQRRLHKLALYIHDVMDAPDVLAVEEAEKLGVLQDLAAAIAAIDPGAVYTAYLVEGNDIGGIDTGFLVRDTVHVLGVTQLAAGETLSVDGSPLHDRPPLLLEAELTGGAGASGIFPIDVLALHQRSLGGIEDPSDGPRVRQKRLEQAESVAAIVQDLQTANPDVHLLVVGDFNAFEFSDGYVDVVGQIAGDFDPAASLLSGPDLVDPNLAKLTLTVPAAERYSFNFDGTAQAIDHALSSSALTGRVTRVEYARGNSDAAENLIYDAGTPLRASDHDGLVVHVLADADGDGVLDGSDACPGTTIPEAAPTVRLLPWHFALVDGDGTFDVGQPDSGAIEPGDVTVAQTAGCSCEQIVAALGLGNGPLRFGCPRGVLNDWITQLGN